MSLNTIAEVQAFYRQAVVLTHRQRVTRLYRKSLRTLDSWAANREIFNSKAEGIRKRFDANTTLGSDVGLAQRLVREGEEELAKWTHPDMYTVPYMPGGSKFMRNPALPLAALYPEGIPDDVNIAAKDVNGIQVPMSAQPKGMQTVLIDVMKKAAE